MTAQKSIQAHILSPTGSIYVKRTLVECGLDCDIHIRQIGYKTLKDYTCVYYIHFVQYLVTKDLVGNRIEIQIAFSRDVDNKPSITFREGYKF